jgi:type I site-specific restriction-modification system R (restriction) subunit
MKETGKFLIALIEYKNQNGKLILYHAIEFRGTPIEVSKANTKLAILCGACKRKFGNYTVNFVDGTDNADDNEKH